VVGAAVNHGRDETRMTIKLGWYRARGQGGTTEEDMDAMANTRLGTSCRSVRLPKATWPRLRGFGKAVVLATACLLLWLPSVDAAGLVFLSDRDHTTEGWDIFVLSPLDAEPVRLTNGLVYDPAPFPDGRRIAYVPNRGAIHVLDLLTRGTQPLYGGWNWGHRHPSISPDGRWLLFSGRDPGPGFPLCPGMPNDWAPEGCNYLYRVNLSSNALERLRSEPARMYQGLYSPDQAMIAYVQRPEWKYPPDTGILWVMHADGSDPRVLHEGPVDRQASWSPDGTRILYSYQEDLWTIQPATGAVERMTNTEFQEHSPAYSPDGSQVAFVGSVGGPPRYTYDDNIWIYDASFSQRTAVTHSPARYSDVHWLNTGPTSLVQATTWALIKRESTRKGR